MKKFLAIAILALSFATASAFTVDDVFNAFPDADNVEKVDIDKDMLKMKVSNLPGELKDINGIKVINIKKPTAQQFSTARQFLDAQIDGMDLMLDANEHGENVSIYTSTTGNVANKLLIVVVNDNNEAVIVLIDGKINVSDIGNLIKVGK